MTDAFFDSLAGNSGDSSVVTAVDSCNSSVSGGGDGQSNGNVSCRSFTDSQFSGQELCVPYDDLAELEWLSNFVEESFSSDDVHNLHFIPTNTTAAAAEPTATSSSATTISILRTGEVSMWCVPNVGAKFFDAHIGYNKGLNSGITGLP
ncbi:GATA transcription factor 9-like [Forsythia ovata]|uniref:GATA transcription factor 9-like n=1 Tax=Forsythia ovata TaxID=205694 RepID=A0ABD1TU43_9LAMI